MPQLRILAVDDEISLLELMRAFLGRLGHEVELFTLASEAIERVKGAPKMFHVAIVDLSMPEMSGEELLHELLRADGELRVLVCSGYPFETSHLPAEVQGRIGFLQKPFLPPMLEKEVERLARAGA